MKADLRTWDAWETIHQPFELSWWRERLPDHLADPAFADLFDEVKAFVRPHGKVIDIGCGPRPPFAPCTVIEPLAIEYQELVPPEWWHGVEVFARPAEEFIEHLRGDTIVCWNAIDHAVGWRDILANMRAYGNPGAVYAIATDFWPEPFDGHPGFPREEFMAEIDRHFEILESREPFGRHLAMRMKGA